jgi:hypothetical protein
MPFFKKSVEKHTENTKKNLLHIILFRMSHSESAHNRSFSSAKRKEASTTTTTSTDE